MTFQNRQFVRQDLLELAAAYAAYSVIITTAELDSPGPQFLYVNSAFTRMTGYSVLDVLGKTPRILQGPKTNRETTAELRKALTAGEDFIARATNYKRDGTPFELEWIISHLRDSSGRTTHYIALQRDITGQERAQDELIRYDAELRNASKQFAETVTELEQAEHDVDDRARLAMLGELAEGVVHDISNAITPVFSMVQLLQSLDNLPQNALASVTTLAASTQHAVDLLANLKLFYRSSRLAIVRTQVDLRPLLESVPTLTKSKWWSLEQQTKCPIEFELELAQAPVVLGNETQLMQVLANLVNNAIESMPHGGKIRIELSSNANNVTVKVSDTGLGMSDEDMRRCFATYFTTRTNGSGLGLSVCRRIVEDHQGRIEVIRNVPKGMTFTIQLPVAVSVDQPAVSQARKSTRILHIDSNHLREDLLTSKLRRRGYDVVVASSGDEGLREFFQSEYGLVIASSEMHPTSGYDVAQAIKRSRPNIPVAVSVHSENSIVPNNLPIHLHPDAVIRSDTSEPELNLALNKLGLQ